MKKTILAVSLTAIFTTSAVNAAEIFTSEIGNVDFYGQLRTQLEFNDDEDATLNAGSSRTGVTASYTIAKDIKVFGGVEFGLGGNSTDDDSLSNRLHYAGVEGAFGKLTVGKQWVVADDTWGADYSYFFGGNAVALAEDSELSWGLHTSLIKYNGEFSGVWIAANVGLGEDDENPEIAELFVGTDFGDVAVHVGGGVDEKSSIDKKNTYAEINVEYTLGAALIGAQYYYSELEDDGTSTDRDGFAIAGTYDINDKLGLYAGYELVDYGNDSDSEDTIYLGSVYQFNQFSKIYGEYGSVDSENNFAVGFRVYW